MAALSKDQQEQNEIASRLQLALLRHYEAKLLDGTISDTGMGNLQRLLTHNGWSLDPSALSDELRGKLVDGLPIDEDEMPDVLPMRRRA